MTQVVIARPGIAREELFIGEALQQAVHRRAAQAGKPAYVHHPQTRAIMGSDHPQQHGRTLHALRAVRIAGLAGADFVAMMIK